MDLKAQISEARQKVVQALDLTSGPDILDTLKKEHETVKTLLATLTDCESAAQRRSLVRKIAAELVPHTVAEEKVVYRMVIALSDRQCQVDGYEGSLEHEWASKTLQRLAAIGNANSPQHKATAKVLRELVEHHIREEEQAIWRDVRKHCSDEDRARLNAEYAAEKRRVKLPHKS